MSVKSKMTPSFMKLKGGLFESVMKADVGSFYTDLAKNGVDLMGWADPFYPDPSIPKHIMEAAVHSLESGFPSHYTMPRGSLELRRQIASKLKRRNGIDADPERNIVVTPGSDSGLLFAMMPFINPGDEVIVFDPSYPSNFLNPELLGGVTVRVPLQEENSYQIDVNDFIQRLTPKTKMVLLTQPNNPTTTVFRRNTLEALAKVIVERDLVAVVDQAFESTIFDNIEFVNIATLPGMWERTLSVFSISKGMGLSGFRVGYIVANDEIMDVLYACSVNVLGATNTMAQAAAIAAFQDDSFVLEYNKIHNERRAFVYDAMNSIPGVSMLMPESGFYSWINVSGRGDSTDICSYLISEARVAANDGKAYGEQGKGHIRLIHGSYRDNDKAYDAIKRIQAALLRYK